MEYKYLRKVDSTPWYLSLAGLGRSEVVYNPETGYYYMFLAYGSLAVEYNTRVVRARSMNGRGWI